jgi:hypothetical protein
MTYRYNIVLSLKNFADLIRQSLKLEHPPAAMHDVQQASPGKHPRLKTLVKDELDLDIQTGAHSSVRFHFIFSKVAIKSNRC